MMEYYIEPWKHQSNAIEASHNITNLALFWEMGTGKSAALINILRHRYQDHGGMQRTLILAPVIVLENWKNEFKMHSKIQPKNIIVLKGSQQQRLKLFREHCRGQTGTQKIIITNYESMQMEDLFMCITQWAPEILVCDESHRLKSIESKRSKRVFLLSQYCKHKYLLTGTPILNSAMDVFQQFKILDGGETFGSNFYSFRSRWFEDRNRNMPSHVHFPNFQPKPGTYDQFSGLISNKALRAVKSECLDLPPLIKQALEVELNRDQAKAYRSMKNEFIAYIKDQEGKDKAVIANLAITKGLRLQQIVSGFCVTDEKQTVPFKGVPRLDTLKTLLQDLTGEHKVIVWACFKENYRQIRILCEKLKIEYCEIHGEIRDKEKELNKFRNRKSCRVAICNQASAGIGINLVEASYSIYYSRNFSLEQDIQSEARNYRGGSEVHKKITRIDLVTPGSIDELVMKALRDKQNIADIILDWDV